MATITVVIPAYNASKYLDATVQSVVDQKFRDWETIIVDDGSKDDTAQIARAWAKRDPRIRFQHQDNGGVSVARNAGFAAAPPESSYIIFLDADDLWEPDCLQNLFDAAESDPQCVGAVGRMKQIDKDGNPISVPMRAGSVEAVREVLRDGKLVTLTPDQPTTFESLIVSGSIWTPGTVLVRLAALRKTGGFDTTLFTAEDNDLWLRLSRLGHIRFVDKHVIRYRHHENMKSGLNRGRTLRAMRRGFQNAARHKDNTPEQNRMIARSFRAVEARNAQGRLSSLADAIKRGKLKDAAVEVKVLAGGLIRYAAGPKNVCLLD